MTLQEFYKTAVQDANRGQYAEAIRKLVLILTHEIGASDNSDRTGKWPHWLSRNRLDPTQGGTAERF